MTEKIKKNVVIESVPHISKAIIPSDEINKPGLALLIHFRRPEVKYKRIKTTYTILNQTYSSTSHKEHWLAKSASSKLHKLQILCGCLIKIPN